MSSFFYGYLFSQVLGGMIAAKFGGESGRGGRPGAVVLQRHRKRIEDGISGAQINFPCKVWKCISRDICVPKRLKNGCPQKSINKMASATVQNCKDLS